jgi:hypothetical protein
MPAPEHLYDRGLSGVNLSGGCDRGTAVRDAGVQQG